MRTRRPRLIHWGHAAIMMTLILCAEVFGQAIEFRLDASSRGMAPKGPGPALTIPVPDGAWTPAGTLAFRMRLSRAIRFNPDKPPALALVRCPLFTLKLMERKSCVHLSALMAVEGKRTKAMNKAVYGRLDWSHLKGGAWYELTFTWDSAGGRMDTYLNGALQQEMRLRALWLPWKPPANPSGALELGGIMGRGDTAVRVAIDEVRLYPRFMDEAAVKATLKGRPSFTLTGEGRWDYAGSLDLKPYQLTLVYEADFSKPLNWVHEDGLFDGDQRARLPQGKDWVLEGGGKAWTEKGRVIVQSSDNGGRGHLVLWNTRPFPENFLLEFGMSPRDSRNGLTIIFFAVKNLKGGSPWDLWTPRRAGDFRTYHSGALNGYHTSYWAANPGILRRTTNLRKNAGFLMPAAGIDRIGGMGPGPHRVRLLKVGGMIRLETRGRLALVYDDDGATCGPVWKDGWIGLRQMSHTRRNSYTHFKVWQVEPR